ncbi:glycosyl transferase [Aspergillus aurantiobrunneus]
MKIRWFGWPDTNIEDLEERKVAAAALADKDAVGVFIDKDLAHSHYNDVAKGTDGIAWPILHYQSGVDFNEDAWKAYQRVNKIFAHTVADSVSSGDLIWVHDYRLLLFLAYLRDRLETQGKKCPVGFTLHTPFPAQDFWKTLPVQRELLTGVLACDLIGLHTDEYKQNFVECCARELEVKVDGNDIEYQGHKVHIDTFIVGIDPQKFSNGLLDEDVEKRVEELENEYSSKITILGVDRLDHTKGLLQKLQGYDHLLQLHPDLKNKVALIQVAIPSREDVKEYQDLEKELSMLVGKINGEHCIPSSFSRYSQSTLTDSNSNSRWRDGMNLVAAEYVACQKNRYGVLVLSEVAGAATFMGAGSITFNPSSAQQLSDSIYKAATMSLGEKEKRYLHLEEFITTNTRYFFLVL